MYNNACVLIEKKEIERAQVYLIRLSNHIGIHWKKATEEKIQEQLTSIK